MLNWFGDNSSVVKRNFVCNVFDGALFSFAMSFVSLSTVLPVFIKRIGGSNIAIGLIPVFWTVGFNFPQILIANYSGSQPYKKELLLKTSLGQRLPWLLMSIVSFWVIESAARDLRLIIFFFCFALAAVAGSLNLPGWFDLIAKITPVQLRGRLFAIRSILGGLLGIIGGWTVGLVLSSIGYPGNYSLLFLLAFCMMMMSYVFITQLKEEYPDAPKDRVKYMDFIRKLPGILRKEKNFRNYLVADALLITALMGDVFYSINALSRFSLPDSYIGNFTIIIMSSMIVGNLFFGYLADHFGHKLNLLLAALSTITACSIALTSYHLESYMIVFIGSSFTATLLQVSRLPIIAELCSENDRQTFIALTNMITGPFSLAGIAGGWIANKYGYNIVFIIAGLCALLSALWMLTMVKEPRKITEILKEA